MQFSQSEYSFDVKKISLAGNLEIAFADEGRGDQTILFIHGLGSYIPAWKKNINVLKHHFRCIVIDLPGYGKSSREVHSGKMDFYSSVLQQLVTKLQLKNVTLAGHSMGGHIAINTALMYFEIIKKLILIAPAGFEEFSADEIEWSKKTYTPQYFEAASDSQIKLNVEANFFNMPEDAEFMISDRINMKEEQNFSNYCTVVSNSLRGMLENPLSDRLSLIKQPTLVFFGLNDKFIPNRIFHKTTTEEIARTGTDKIPNSKLIMIPECGHFIPFEKPDEFNNAVINFLTS